MTFDDWWDKDGYHPLGYDGHIPNEDTVKDYSKDAYEAGYNQRDKEVQEALTDGDIARLVD